MRTLKIINPENVDKKNLEGWQHRKAARAVVLDNRDRVGLLHVKGRDYYKLPGGGIKEREEVIDALCRECEEELGVKIKAIEEIGNIEEFRVRPKLHQTSYCFFARTNSNKKTPKYSEREKSSGYKTIWVTLNEALKLLNLPDKTHNDYGRRFTKERDLYFLNEVLKSKML